MTDMTPATALPPLTLDERVEAMAQRRAVGGPIADLLAVVPSRGLERAIEALSRARADLARTVSRYGPLPGLVEDATMLQLVVEVLRAERTDRAHDERRAGVAGA